MKKLALLTFCFCLFVISAPQVTAQENYTEGPVWVINYYRTKPGKFDDYMKFLRANFAKSSARQKQDGIIVDAKVLLNPTVSGPDDWDIAIAYLYSDYGKALNFNQADFDKLENINAEISRQRDREKRAATLDATRFPLRDHVRTRIIREVSLRPMP